MRLRRLRSGRAKRSRRATRRAHSFTRGEESFGQAYGGILLGVHPVDPVVLGEVLGWCSMTNPSTVAKVMNRPDINT